SELQHVQRTPRRCFMKKTPRRKKFESATNLEIHFVVCYVSPRPRHLRIRTGPDDAWRSSKHPRIQHRAQGRHRPTRSHQHQTLCSSKCSPFSVSRFDIRPSFSGFLFETPASLACIYNLVPQANGCNPKMVSSVATGGAVSIAI